MKNISKILKQALRKSAQNIIEEGPKQLLTEQATNAQSNIGCGATYSTLCGTWDNVNNTNSGGVLPAGHQGCCCKTSGVGSTNCNGGPQTGMCAALLNIPNWMAYYSWGNVTSVGVLLTDPNASTYLPSLPYPSVATNNAGQEKWHQAVVGCVRPYSYNQAICPIDIAMDFSSQTDPCHMDNYFFYADSTQMSGGTQPSQAFTGTVPSLSTGWNGLYNGGSTQHPNPSTNPWFGELLSSLGLTAGTFTENPYCVAAFGTAACGDYATLLTLNTFNSTATTCGAGTPCIDPTPATLGTGTPYEYGIPAITFDCVSGLCEENIVGTGNFPDIQTCAQSTACQMHKCNPNQPGGSCDPCDFATEYNLITLEWDATAGCDLDDVCTGAPCGPASSTGCSLSAFPSFTFPWGCDPNDNYHTWPGGYTIANGLDFTWYGPTVVVGGTTINNLDTVTHPMEVYLAHQGSYCEWCHDWAQSSGTLASTGLGGLNERVANHWYDAFTSATNWSAQSQPTHMMTNGIESACCCCPGFIWNPPISLQEQTGIQYTGGQAMNPPMTLPAPTATEIIYVCSNDLGCIDVNTEEGIQAVNEGGLTFPNIQACELDCRPPKQKPEPTGGDVRVCCDWCASVDPNTQSFPPEGCEDWNCDDCEQTDRPPVIQPLVQQEGLQIKGKLLNESRMKQLAGIVKKRK